ncbi:MAG: NAD(P)-dependent oxidoreductase [Gemmatimonadales bacterium]
MPADLNALEHELSEPTDATVALFTRLEGDVLILGAGGKMGPSLARLAARSARLGGRPRRILAASRFSEPGLRDALSALGIETFAVDLLDRAAVARLPEASNLIFMAGQKFGTADGPERTWAINVLLPSIVAERYPSSRLVAFSSGNVYPLWPAEGPGPSETVPPAPVGEYAQTVLGRERVLAFHSARSGTRMAILRLNYAVEPRYGVLRDLADRIVAGEAISLGMPAVNLIWQRDANAVALLALEHCASPPTVLNLTGARHSVRRLAERLAAALGEPVRFEEPEGPTALLSDSTRAHRLFGEPPTGIETMIERVAAWVLAGGASLEKPTHFEEREGRF